MVDVYHKAEKLYQQGQYSQALTLLNGHWFQDGSVVQCKKNYFLALLLSVELKDFELFKNFLIEQRLFFCKNMEPSNGFNT